MIGGYQLQVLASPYQTDHNTHYNIIITMITTPWQRSGEVPKTAQGDPMLTPPCDRLSGTDVQSGYCVNCEESRGYLQLTNQISISG